MSSGQVVGGRTFVAETTTSDKKLATFLDLKQQLLGHYEKITFIGALKESTKGTKIYIQCQTKMLSNVLARIFENAHVSLVREPDRFEWPDFPKSMYLFKPVYGSPQKPGVHGNGVKEMGKEDVSHLTVDDIRSCLGSREENISLTRQVCKPSSLPDSDDGILDVFKERLFFTFLERFEVRLQKCRGRSVKEGTRSNMNIRFGLGTNVKRFAFYDVRRRNIRKTYDFFSLL
ncbi:FirrV-1-A2 [Feldmannia irregularis virus a]|uniref:FirrV-1-A2 n=1 Tax=Feldmannia irregularis virus a TaxID=231992 RepID=Q6XM85_9PHYC|nr:FirrV-1-A2 [Feldmannia irregularis virus a]AAR26826.1 FirrV-1-A2 [Feldmannia irregularis virus a]